MLRPTFLSKSKGIERNLPRCNRLLNRLREIENKKDPKTGSFLLRLFQFYCFLFPFPAFGGNPLGGCDCLFRGLAYAFGRFALAFAVLVASPCRAFVEFHKCRPVETFVRHLAEIGDVRVGLGLGFQLPARR